VSCPAGLLGGGGICVADGWVATATNHSTELAAAALWLAPAGRCTTTHPPRPGRERGAGVCLMTLKKKNNRVE